MSSVNQEEVDAFVRKLHEDGLSIIATIKAVRETFPMNLGEAKRAVAGNPVWHETVQANTPLHNDAIAAALAMMAEQQPTD